MAKLLVKFQRYFRRKPVRFFTLIVLYLTAGSLVFLHSGFAGEPTISENEPNPVDGTSEGTAFQYLGVVQLGRGFKETSEARNSVRRYGPWFKSVSKDTPERNKMGDYGGAWSRALKGRKVREKEEDRAKYIGCYVDSTRRRALRGVSFFDYKKMTVFRCQDNCAERGYLYAGLEFGAECYCGHKIQALNVSESECNMECKGEKSNFCGGVNRLSIYRLELAQESTRRYGSAIFRGCFHRPDNVSLALPVTGVMLNMSVDKCVDFCTEKEYPLAALGGASCHCGFPTTLFTLHEREDEQLCAQKCGGEEFESCGTAEYFIMYQTQVQGLSTQMHWPGRQEKAHELLNFNFLFGRCGKLQVTMQSSSAEMTMMESQNRKRAPAWTEPEPGTVSHLDLEPVPPKSTQGCLPDPPGGEETSAACVSRITGSSPSQRLAKIRRRKKCTRDEMFSELMLSSHTDRAQTNAWRQTMSECRKAQNDWEERWRAEESK
ncbi:sialate:O-sulfotransferase 2 isoform X2 [Lepidochelys kempii]|uniref:sialate:O-sulfotransferase 2 isoform X2 n=1 Tax=Lepidochelys kempii TaxID=8472 RepID=UPI003C6F9B87